jgi:hypothetical protein
LGAVVLTFSSVSFFPLSMTASPHLESNRTVV